MLIVLVLLPFSLAFILTPLLASFLSKRNLTDRPDGDRKLHVRPIPRMGGVAVFIAFIVTVSAVTLLWPSETAAIHISSIVRLAPALIVIFGLGVIDDMYSLSARKKLNIQVCAGVIAVAMGCRFGVNNDVSIPLSLIQAALTVFWLVLCTNSFNLIDGIDGLAAGLGLILAATIAFGAAHVHQQEVLFLSVLFAACLVGFLRHNFYPASIFLGDSGSLTTGFFLGCLAVLWSNQQSSVTGKLSPFVAFLVPLVDVSLSVSRRFLSGRPIFSADRDHIHHRLLRRGLSPLHTTLLLYWAAFLASIASLTCALFSPLIAVFTLVGLGMATILACRSLNYVEFRALKLAVQSFSVTRSVIWHITLSNFYEALKATDDNTLFWIAIKQACFDFGFDAVRLTSDGHVYEDGLSLCPIESRTSLFLSVDEDNSLALSGSFSPIVHHPAFGAFLASVLDELRVRSSSRSPRAHEVTGFPTPDVPAHVPDSPTVYLS